MSIVLALLKVEGKDGGEGRGGGWKGGMRVERRPGGEGGGQQAAQRPEGSTVQGSPPVQRSSAPAKNWAVSD